MAPAPVTCGAPGRQARPAFLDRRDAFLDIAATAADTLERVQRAGDPHSGANANGALESAMAAADRFNRDVATGALAELQPLL